MKSILSIIRFLALFFAIGILFGKVAPALAASTWTNQGTMNWTQAYHKAVLLDDGKVLIAGGDYTSSHTNHVQLYTDGTGSSGSWQNRADMIKDRDEFTLHYVTISGGGKRVLAIGGASQSCSCVQNTAELWNQSTNSWAATVNMSTTRRSHASSILSDGKVLVTGGLNNSLVRLSTTEIYDPVNNTWTAAASMGANRASHAQITFTDNNGNSKVMVIGGSTGSGATATTEIYDPSNNSWSAGPSMNDVRFRPEVALLNDGRILAMGWASGSDVYDPSTNAWSSYSTPYSNGDMKVVALGSGAGYKALAAGGSNSSNAMLFDPSTNTWSTTANMYSARQNFSLTLLNNGEVLAAGGSNSGGIINLSERFSY